MSKARKRWYWDLWVLQDGICALCHKPLHVHEEIDGAVHKHIRNTIDHIHPVIERETYPKNINDRDNLQLVHDTCNFDKSDIFIDPRPIPESARFVGPVDMIKVIDKDDPAYHKEKPHFAEVLQRLNERGYFDFW